MKYVPSIVSADRKRDHAWRTAELDLRNNRLVCNTSLCWLLEPSHGITINIDAYPCREPPDMIYVHWKELKQKVSCSKCNYILDRWISLERIVIHILTRELIGLVPNAWGQCQAHTHSHHISRQGKIGKGT